MGWPSSSSWTMVICKSSSLRSLFPKLGVDLFVPSLITDRIPCSPNLRSSVSVQEHLDQHQNQGNQVTDAVSWSPCLLRVCEGSGTCIFHRLLRWSWYILRYETTTSGPFPHPQSEHSNFAPETSSGPTPNTYCSFQCPTTIANLLRDEFIWCLILYSGSDIRCVAWTGLDSYIQEAEKDQVQSSPRKMTYKVNCPPLHLFCPEHNQQY